MQNCKDRFFLLYGIMSDRAGHLCIVPVRSTGQKNEDNTAWFLKEHPDFSLEFQRQIFPGEAGSDGFFSCKAGKE